MHRFFAPQDQIPTITGSDAHQIKNVLRLKIGDQIELLDGTGKIHTSKIIKIEQNKIDCEILTTKQDKAESKIKVTLAQCLPKAKKMDLIIQKCTELGVNQIIPTLSERSIAKGEKADRWQKIAKEAAEQSGRSIIPEISPLTKFEDVLKMKSNFDLALIPWELEKETSLKSILTTYQPIKLLVLIGPEGGFSQEEIELAQQAGFTSVSLGQRILRTETAGMAILAMIIYASE
ncbi:MAG: 16S rRNA (uracil(1498)-N(3))-methyltransferase [Candidatus Margulisbacteria bacterium]|nr:16S rRNA (uracil(1498)-N(3))-methyltransferase [Candidatus Margulisiibacteriota bacterium]